MMDELPVSPEIQSELKSEERENDQLKLSDDFIKATEKLSSGLLNIYQPPLSEIKKELKELTEKQESLLHQMQTEDEKLRGIQEDTSLNEMFSLISTYQNKLAYLKSMMITIHERTSKLKSQALKLQKIKEKEALIKEKNREEQLRREQELIGKPEPKGSKC